AIASVSIGRSRLPPEEIRWLATSGIMVTSEPVRERMVALTRSMSAATSATSGSIDASWGLSKGTITATPRSTFASLKIEHRNPKAASTGLPLTCGAGPTGVCKLRELVRTNDIVLVSAIGALLDGANIHHLVLDQNMSIIEGSLGILPRRILVHEEDNRAARQILTEAGLSHELRPDE